MALLALALGSPLAERPAASSDPIIDDRKLVYREAKQEDDALPFTFSQPDQRGPG